MNSKDRVLTALRRTGVPDRVPIQFDTSMENVEAFIAAVKTHGIYA